MKKGCLVFLAQFIILALVYYLGLHRRVSPPGDWVGALVGAFGMSLLIGAFRNAAAAWGDSRRFGRALSGEPFRDGERIAAIGPIWAAEPLEAPFSHRKCVIYDYAITHESQTNIEVEGGVKDVGGFAQTPCSIHTPSGGVRLLGWPVLQGFSEERFAAPGHFENARDYLDTRRFEQMGITRIGKVFHEIKDLMTDDDGAICKDWALAPERFEPDPQMHELKEKIVADGEAVCAMGRYSAEREGIVLDFSKGLLLIRGKGEGVQASLRSTFLQNLAVGLIFPIVIHGFLFAILFMRAHQP